MAFIVKTFRLPEDYAAYIERIAGKEDESQGYLIQRAIYQMGNGALREPRRCDRDREVKDKNAKGK